MGHWIVVLGVVACLGIVFPTAARGENPPAKLTINDSFMPGSQLLFSDGNSVNHPELGPMYVDWRLASGDPCVKGWVKTADGFFFMYTNRGSNFGEDCEENFAPPRHRRYRVQFPAESGICPALGLGDGPCEVRAARIRAENLFGKKVQEATVAFMFHHGGNSYSLDTAGEISVVSADTRTLANATRTATLRKFGFFPGTKTPGSTPVGSPFVFPFELTVTRVLQ